jgi:hypothetical protein
MVPETAGYESPPIPVSPEQLRTAGAAQVHEESAKGLPTPSNLEQLNATAAGIAGPPAPSEQAVSGPGAAAPPKPDAPEQLGEKTGEAAAPEPASLEELAARAEGSSSG